MCLFIGLFIFILLVFFSEKFPDPSKIVVYASYILAFSVGISTIFMFLIRCPNCGYNISVRNDLDDFIHCPSCGVKLN